MRRKDSHSFDNLGTLTLRTGSVSFRVTLIISVSMSSAFHEDAKVGHHRIVRRIRSRFTCDGAGRSQLLPR